VTAYWKTLIGENESLFLDIIELIEPVHDRAYFCKKLLEVTNRLSITCAIISITRDNTSPNDKILEYFEAYIKS
jgi:hypothetical protein